MIGEALAAAADRLGDAADSVLSRLGGPDGHAARAAAATLHALPAVACKAKRATWAATARAPIPEGLRAVHPTWIEAALAELPPRARQALAAPSDPVDVWLARWACSGLPPMQPARLPLDVKWLVAIGADQLAFALGDGAVAAAAQLPALRAAIGRVDQPPRRGELGPKRAALVRCAGLALNDELSLIRIAGRALAPHLAADRLARLQLTRSLPRPLGLVVERELFAHAATSLDQVPTWAALIAR